MKLLAAIATLSLSAAAVLAQTSAISRTGQFIITGLPPGVLRPFTPEISTNSALVKLEPALVAVSCERIKQALLGALAAPDQWRGKIHIVLHPARLADEDIMVASTRFADGWQYEVSLPDAVAPGRFIRVITQVLLVEMANRQLPPESASLPAWLGEGMPQYLVASSDVDLVLRPAAAGLGNQPAVSLEKREGRHVSPFAKARERLRRREPLTIKQLGNPDIEQLAGLDGETYRDTALLFINELLQLPNGGACLAGMLPELPWDPDWRVAFLKSFRPHFKRAVDFEKWWALQSAYIAGRDPNQTWPRAETVAKLQEILRTPFEVRLGSNEPALYTDVGLQDVIKGWKLERQSPVLREKINLLQNLGLRAAAELQPLIRQYHDVLATYLDRMEGGSAKQKSSHGRNPVVSAHRPETSAPSEDDPFVKETLAQLDELDTRCAAWRVTHDRLPQTAP